MKLSVMKLGGSLLDLPDLAERILHIVDHRNTGRWLLIVGGGEIVDTVRRYDEQWSLPPEVSHHAAIRGMSVNASVVRSLHERFTSELLVEETSLVSVPNPEALLERLEREFPEQRLPTSWHVTSDSIAAWVAEKLKASELLLLKSTDAKHSSAAGISRAETLTDLQERGSVDNWFTNVASSIPVLSWCNLRSPELAVEGLGEDVPSNAI